MNAIELLQLLFWAETTERPVCGPVDKAARRSRKMGLVGYRSVLGRDCSLLRPDDQNYRQH